MRLNRGKFIFVILGLLVFLPLLTLAAEGLVPCGNDLNGNGKVDPEEACSFCHLFQLFDNIVDFILVRFVPPLAILMLVVGGVMFIAGAGSPAQINKGKGILTATITGLAIVYVAWLLVSFFFEAIGVATWTGLQGGWFTFPCEVP